MVRELILSRCEKREVIQWVQFERSASSRREHIENLLIGHELAGLQLSADIATSVKYSISYLGYFRQKKRCRPDVAWLREFLLEAEASLGSRVQVA